MVGYAPVICTFVRQDEIDRTDVTVILVRGADPGDADRIPFVHENVANARSDLISLIFVASASHMNSAVYR
jgi:hypothetical protein